MEVNEGIFHWRPIDGDTTT